MPNGIPIIIQIIIPIIMIEVVSMALSQNFGCRKPIKNVQNPTKIVVPTFLPLEKKTIATTSAITYTVSLVAWGGPNGTIRVNNRDHENDGIQLVAYELSA